MQMIIRNAKEEVDMKNTNENSNNLNMVFKRVEKKYLLNEEQNRRG